MRKTKQIREENFILEGESSLLQVFNWKDGHFVSMESFIIIPFIYEHFCFLFQRGWGKGCCFEPCGLAAASLSGQEPLGLVWQQGGKAGRIDTQGHPGQFPAPFRPGFHLIPSLEGFYWMCLCLQKCQWKWGPRIRWGFRSSASGHGLHRGLQLPRMVKRAFPYFRGDWWGSVCLRLWQWDVPVTYIGNRST